MIIQHQIKQTIYFVNLKAKTNKNFITTNLNWLKSMKSVCPKLVKGVYPIYVDTKVCENYWLFNKQTNMWDFCHSLEQTVALDWNVILFVMNEKEKNNFICGASGAALHRMVFPLPNPPILEGGVCANRRKSPKVQ